MRLALSLAEKGMGRTSPNPMVGAVIVKDGRIIGQGYHEAYGGLHAERNALLSCSESPEGADLYVTLEPCCHYGKQPPCTQAILEAGIRRVAVGVHRPQSPGGRQRHRPSLQPRHPGDRTCFRRSVPKAQPHIFSLYPNQAALCRPQVRHDPGRKNRLSHRRFPVDYRGGGAKPRPQAAPPVQCHHDRSGKLFWRTIRFSPAGLKMAAIPSASSATAPCARH